jgi:hypothetical protein
LSHSVDISVSHLLSAPAVQGCGLSAGSPGSLTFGICIGIGSICPRRQQKDKEKPTSFQKLFESFLDEHNLLIDPRSEQKRVFNSLRHTYATLALTHDKVPIHTLAKQMQARRCVVLAGGVLGRAGKSGLIPRGRFQPNA